MSSGKPPKKKKVVVTTKASAASAAARTRKSSALKAGDELTFGKTNYMWMGGGALMIALGLLLMSGGKMPSPDVWDDSIIYSTRRTLIAPVFIIAGLVVEIYAIFVKEKPSTSAKDVA